MKNPKETIKNIILVTLLLVALSLIYIFARYWSVAVEAFKAGFYNY